MLRSYRYRLAFRLAALGILAASATPAHAETDIREFHELTRRGFLGVDLGRSEDGQPQITGLHPKGGAARADVRVGDEILAVNGQKVDFGLSLGIALQPLRAGSELMLTLRRGDETVESAVTLRPLGFEKPDDLDVIYDVVPNGDTKLRCFVTKPLVGSSLPAIFFIQGLSCNSVEEPVEDPSTVLDLLHQLTLRGFVTMRTEKSGVGDSEGESCFEIGFHDEVKGFQNAFDKLLSYDFVDPDNVFVFGHSMGGTMAPIVAADRPVRGIVVFGTAVTKWGDYLAENSLRQGRLSGADLAELETRVGEEARFHRLVLDDGKSPAEIVTLHPELEAVANSQYPDGAHSFTRSVRFFRELNAFDVAGAWSRIDVPVLALCGEFDYATSPAEHEAIAEIVNAAHPGRATWKELPRTFHAFNERATLKEAIEAPWAGPLQTAVADEIVHFVRANLSTNE